MESNEVELNVEILADLPLGDNKDIFGVKLVDKFYLRFLQINDEEMNVKQFGAL